MLRPLLRFFLLAALSFPALHAGPVPPELAHALKLFRAEGARSWAFTQTTESGGKSLVERFDPAKPDFSQWTLLKKDGNAPTAPELKDYQDRLSRRTSGGTAPNVKDQIDPASCELVHDEGDRVAYRFHLQPGGTDDRSAAHMIATFTLHKSTATIEKVELNAFEPFSPMFTVKITKAETTMLYSVPDMDHPSLLRKITISIRGHAMWLKSLDEDMTVTYSDHEYTGKKPAAPAAKIPLAQSAPEASLTP